MQHVATWKEGEDTWAYHPDAFEQIATHKVSLDPYRLESRRILSCIKDVLPAPPIQRVEKASVDEVFLDLSAQIHSTLIERYPEIGGPAPYDDPTEFLPRPPTTALDWDTDALVDLDSSETEDDDPDWDDIAMLVGSEIVRSVRVAIRERLKYTCSAGVAHNKMIAKLGSAYQKPNQQTVVRNRAIQQFLSNFKFTKIRNLGGKLGEEIVSKFGTDQVKDLLAISLEQLKFKIGDDTGSWVYGIIRGEDSSEVNCRTQIKSMLSAKSFRPTINSFEQAVKWCRIFVSDIFSRLVEEGVLENKRRPKTINLHHRQGAQMRSRQAPIPTGKSIDKALLFEIAKNLLAQVVVDGRAWPCSNLQLSVGGFEDGPISNRGIGSFLVRGDEAKAMKPVLRDTNNHGVKFGDDQSEKRRKLDHGVIQRFFTKREISREDTSEGERFHFQAPKNNQSVLSENVTGTTSQNEPSSNGSDMLRAVKLSDNKTSDTEGTGLENTPTTSQKIPTFQPSELSFICNQCSTSVPLLGKEEHGDWHFATSLQAQERSKPVSISPRSELVQGPNLILSETNSSNNPAAIGNKRIKAGQIQKKNSKGQSRLAFGR